MFVAINTTEGREIARSGVAINTLIPFTIMFTTVNGKILLVVIEAGRIPGIGRVAIFTCDWEAL